MSTELDQRLERHINPERSRQFDVDRWLATRKELADLAQADWLRCAAQIIHVVGSNGKGSTTHYLSQLALKSNSFEQVGTYTSPHLISPTERIKINNQAISEKTALAGLDFLEKKLGHQKFLHFSYFEILTILALFIFAKNHCTFIVLEAGLGGRLDATRMAGGPYLVMTRLSIEHSHLLGDSIRKIATEKLGMATDSTQKLFVLNDPSIPMYNQMIQEILGDLEDRDSILDYSIFESLDNASYLQENFAFAQFIFNSIHKGFPNQLKFQDMEPPPARTEIIHLDQHKKIIYDTAHNPQAIQRVLGDLVHQKTVTNQKQVLVLIGVLKGRDLPEYMGTIKDCGYNHIGVILDDDYASPVDPGILTVPKNRLNTAVLELFNQFRDVHTIIFLGSHRHYKEFKGLQKNE